MSKNVRDELVARVGEDGAVAVEAWLHWVVETHSVEVDDVVYEPSLGWLRGALRKKTGENDN